jgi:hypothetical protein
MTLVVYHRDHQIPAPAPGYAAKIGGLAFARTMSPIRFLSGCRRRPEQPAAAVSTKTCALRGALHRPADADDHGRRIQKPVGKHSRPLFMGALE